MLHTSFKELAWGFALKKSTIVLFSIHGVTMVYSLPSIETPINSNMFGCDRRFQIMTSRQKFCKWSPTMYNRVGRTGQSGSLFLFSVYRLTRNTV